jgi:hypothetical protein
MTNSYEQQSIDLVKQNEALKAQVYSLRKCLTSESQGGIIKNMGFIKGRIEWYDKVKTVLAGTPEQCLNSVKASAAIELAGIFHDGKWRSDTAMLICEEYASKLRAK